MVDQGRVVEVRTIGDRPSVHIRRGWRANCSSASIELRLSGWRARCEALEMRSEVWRRGWWRWWKSSAGRWWGFRFCAGRGTCRSGMILARRAGREKFSESDLASLGRRQRQRAAGHTAGQRSHAAGGSRWSGRVESRARWVCWLCGRYGSTPTGRDCVQIKDPLPKSLSQPQPQPPAESGAR